MKNDGKWEIFFFRGPFLSKKMQKDNKKSSTITNMDQYSKTSKRMLKNQDQVTPKLHLYIINLK